MVDPVELPVYRTLQTAVAGGVATITLNRPRQRNAVGDGMRSELADAYRWCDGADAVRAVVLTGAPPAFCAGADLAAGERTFTEPGPSFSARETEIHLALMAHDDAKEGVRAFMERRAPNWTGRPVDPTA